jgi:2-amino-4-hydroxy-6-hydroxymethyldihydropteridine diphosphokinase
LSAAFLGLGSNLGVREENLEQALARLAAHGFRLRRRSAFYETAPVGGPVQGDFLNMAAGGDWDATPEALLQACLDVEREMGRVRTVRNGPRTIDLDVLLFGDERREGDFELPHPRLHERRFVLEPLCEIAPDARHPGLGLTVRELLARCPDASRVVRHAQAARAAR